MRTGQVSTRARPIRACLLRVLLEGPVNGTAKLFRGYNIPDDAVLIRCDGCGGIVGSLGRTTAVELMDQVDILITAVGLHMCPLVPRCKYHDDDQICPDCTS